MKTITQTIRGNFNWNDECNSDGIIKITTKNFSDGGRTSDEVEWKLEPLSETDDSYYTRATVVNSDIPREFKKGWYIDFDLDKDISGFDIEDELICAIENERR